MNINPAEEYAKLIEKLRRIEALYAGATTPGERVAAAEAHRRVSARLAGLKQPEPAREYRFSLDNSWSRKLFLALLRRHGHRTYRYPRQRYNTVMVRLRESAADTLWEEFVALDQALRDHFNALAERIIAQEISEDITEAEEVDVPTRSSGP
ncbi:MAG: hypothetical protein ACLQVD_02430 [Capsulimonadaceae bacterium]